MNTAIQKWGNSQGIRLNKEILSQSNLNPGDPVVVEAKNNVITIRPLKTRNRKKYSLEKLVEQIPENYTTEEFDFGKPAGREEW
jgi:antitoxin MazE